MVRKKKIKFRLGDVFAVPIADNFNSYGQLVGDDCFAFYNITNRETESINHIVESPILFMAYTIHDLIEDGSWPIIGNASIPRSIIFPYHKVHGSDGLWIVNHNNQLLRKATAEEAKSLEFITHHSPNTLDRAVKAKFLNGEWKDYYNDFIYRGIYK